MTLRRWNWEVFGDVALIVIKTNNRVMNIQERIRIEDFSDDFFQIDSDALVDLDRILRQQEIFLWEKIRVR